MTHFNDQGKDRLTSSSRPGIQPPSKADIICHSEPQAKISSNFWDHKGTEQICRKSQNIIIIKCFCHTRPYEDWLSIVHQNYYYKIDGALAALWRLSPDSVVSQYDLKYIQEQCVTDWFSPLRIATGVFIIDEQVSERARQTSSINCPPELLLHDRDRGAFIASGSSHQSLWYHSMT